MPTFYMAAGGDRWSVVRSRGETLVRLGLNWSFDWTQGVEQLGRGALSAPVSERVRNVEGDLDACRTTDLFVALLDGAGRGAYMEIGARLGVKRKVHVVGGEDRGEEHLFWCSPLVQRHESWLGFLEWLARILPSPAEVVDPELAKIVRAATATVPFKGFPPGFDPNLYGEDVSDRMLAAELELCEIKKFGAANGYVILHRMPSGYGCFSAVGPLRVQGPVKEWILAPGEPAFFSVVLDESVPPSDMPRFKWEKKE